ncbi:MAG: hypothetical protein E3J96_05895 [Sulfurovum sp.]|nr:MAG: hypothetical protein E3J96_05895 [Sulfurovum sp.]
MKTSTSLIERAKEAGCVTASDMAHWIDGYEAGTKDTEELALKIVENINDKQFEPFPSFAEESVRLHEERIKGEQK